MNRRKIMTISDLRKTDNFFLLAGPCVIEGKQVFSGLSNSTVVLFAGMFVVGASMFYTGLAQEIGGVVVKMYRPL